MSAGDVPTTPADPATAAARVTAGTVAVGTELPSLEIPVTRTLIVAGAMASRDFEPVHHDHLVAQERGSDDLFMNILTTNGLVGRFVTDWAGPAARLRGIDIRLGVPAYPGDTLAFSGRVVDVRDRVVTVAVRAANARGDHASGTVEVEVP
ncbi:MAG TPA: MaoC/PaaZ C-terminal domain-containing protein [Acidimicrobiales bacterium]